MSAARRVAQGPRTRALLARAAELEGALGIGADRIPSEVADAVRATIANVRGRLELGVDHTVVALAGGTRSGKSSIFNALSRLEFADVGVRRPTTAEVTACVWARDADPLLDWLGVPTDRRIERESALDGDTEADLRGLVLLDLPDHDSIEPEHRAAVDRLLPQVDLLVWVVDPQKYADDALHNRYLRALIGHEAAMYLLLNQIDTVPIDAQASLLRDVDRLLRGDGLVDVGVLAASARSGEGMPGVRAALARAVAGRGVAEVRAKAELDDAARVLARGVAAQEPDVGAAASRAVDGLVKATGIAAAAAAVRAAIRTGAGTTVRLGPAQPDRAAAVRQVWLDDVAGELPVRWADAVVAAVPDAAALVGSVDTHLGAVDVSTRAPRWSAVLRVLAGLAGVLALAAAGFTAGSLAGDAGWHWDGRTTMLAAVTGAAVALGLLLLGAARWVLRSVAGRRAQAVAASARLALASAVDAALVRPTTAVLEDHRTVREVTVPVLAEASTSRDEASTSRADASTTPPNEAASTA